ncbi:MAG: terminase small subunit [Thermodesulfobacteriota bacterium]|nr:terminase small subunit [Thermodesulfobacteriota bacterium]
MKKTLSGKAVTRRELAEILDIALTTVDSWRRRGCPCVDRPGKGKPSTYDTAAVFRWCLDEARSGEMMII